MDSRKSNAYAEAGMLIRKPVSEVFQAITDPQITTHFWFTKSSGALKEGKEIRWTWEMYNHSVDVSVIKIEPDKSILMSWGNKGKQTQLNWSFRPLANDKTYISVVNSGFDGSTDEILSTVRDATGGFSWVLAGLKAYLEHGIDLNLIADRYPRELGSH
ncbi:SRPBCC family protein [Robiginitalea sp. IMCC44478]|uniref:SRPBCC family protein n=1 Tax=Robiginitalea sp. IMCC44478 TaxID=3459122 RepID=UPI0040430EBC